MEIVNTRLFMSGIVCWTKGQALPSLVFPQAEVEEIGIFLEIGSWEEKETESWSFVLKVFYYKCSFAKCHFVAHCFSM